MKKNLFIRILLSCFIWLTVSIVVKGQCFQVTNPSLSVGNSPHSITAADLNGDDKLDLITANAGANSISVRLNTGNGNFGPTVNYAVGQFPLAVATGDFNKDGKTDVVVANDNSNTVSVLLGNGAGGLGPVNTFSVGSNPRSIAVGDFNQDGREDIAVANSGSNTISILLNNPLGGFQPANGSPISVGSRPFAVITTDLNQDGKLDLISANHDSGTITVLSGSGSGAFSSGSTHTVGNQPFALAARDLNADNKPDVGVANAGSGTVSILLNNATGGFITPTTVTVGSSPYSVALRDLNNDTFIDLAVANGGSGTVSVLPGNGQGGFGNVSTLTVGTTPVSLVVENINEDLVGLPDIAVANFGNSTISILYNCTPALKIQGSESRTVCSGRQVGYLAQESNITPTSYSWSSTPSGISGTDNPLLFFAPTVANPTTYTVVVSVTNGSITKAATVRLTVNPSSNVTITPSRIPVCDVTTLTLTAGGCPVTGSIRWNNGVTTPTLAVTATSQAIPYSVSCTVGNCVSQAEYSLQVLPPTPVTKLNDYTYGGSGNEGVHSVIPTKDGGYVVGGTSNSPSGSAKSGEGIGDYDYWAIRFDKNGNRTWDVSYGGRAYDVMTRMLITPENNFLLLGTSNSGVIGGPTHYYKNQQPLSARIGVDTDAWVATIDSTGKKINEFIYGGIDDDYFYDGKATTDGGYVFVGFSGSQAYGDRKLSPRIWESNRNLWVMKIDRFGRIVWDKTFAGSRVSDTGENTGYSIIQTPDGGYIIGGTATTAPNGEHKKSNHLGGYDYWVLRLDAQGNLLWDKSYGGTGYEVISKVVLAQNGEILLGGVSESGITPTTKDTPSLGGRDLWLVRLDGNGNKVGEKSLGGPLTDQFGDLVPTEDGGWLVSGGSATNTPANPSKGGLDGWLIKLDKNFNQVWEKRWGGNRDEHIQVISPTQDGYHLLAGDSFSDPSGDKTAPLFGQGDIWVLKTWLAAPPTLSAARTTLCGTQTSTTLTAGGCPGLITWSTGATGSSLVVSPAQSTTYSALCSVSGVASCYATPLTIAVCEGGSQSTYGYTKGHFSPTDGGAITYSIPLILPAGSAGTKPDLSLVYNSQGGNGILGVGWNVDGLYVINRVSKTRAQDEASDVSHNSAIGVSLTKEDRFALNGARLVLAPGSIEEGEVLNSNYGNKGTDYITEQQQFSRITIKEVTAQGAPLYFDAYTKDGLIMEFGNSDNSLVRDKDNVPVAWLVSKISDRNGNYIRFIYDRQVVGSADNQVYPYSKINHYPLRIEYTANDAAALAPYNKIEFDYIDRSDKQWSFLAGRFMGGGDRLLKNVRIYGSTGNGPTQSYKEVRRYELNYTTSKFTENSLLYQVRECADTLCHEPTIFHWLNEELAPAALTYKPTSTTTQGPFSESAWLNKDKRVRLFGDWDGDGTNDLCAIDSLNANQTTFTYYLNRFPNSVPGGVTFSLPFNWSNYQFRTSDFNADGKTDIIFWNKKDGDAKIRYSVFYNGQLQEPLTKSINEFIQQSCPTGPNSYTNNCQPIVATDFFKERDIQLVDWNSDGLTDIVSLKKSTMTKYFEPGSDWWLQTQPPAATPTPTSVGEIKMVRQNLSIPAAMSDGSPTKFNRFQIADFNNDGLSDICLIDTARSRLTIFPMLSVKVADKVFDASVSKYRIQDPVYGVQFSNTPRHQFTWNPSPSSNRFVQDLSIDPFNLYNNEIITTDVNGDGLTDIGLKLSATSYQFQLMTGDFTVYPEVYTLKTKPLLSPQVETELVDLNNDGQLDLLAYAKSGVPGSTVQLGGFDKPGMDIDNPLDPSLLSELGVSFHFGHYSKSNLNELLYFKVNGTSLATKLYSNTLSKSDLIGRIGEGSGQDIEITYKTLKDPTVYRRSGIAFSYPLYEFVSPIPIISSVRTKNGIGGFLQTDYQYEGGFGHLLGRGFRGFTKVITKDPQRNVFTIKYFTVDAARWWLAGQPDKTETRLNDPANGKLLSYFEQETGTVPYSRTLTAPASYLTPRSYFTYGRLSTARTYDYTTDQQINYTRSRVIQDDKGNATLVIAEHGEGFRDSTLNTYTDNNSAWLLGRLTRSVVYRFTPGRPVEVRTSTFEYHPATGQLVRQVTDPDSSVQVKTETLYAHDPFGNIISTEMKAWNGTQIESRMTQSVFDTRGRFRVRLINPLGHQVNSTYNIYTGSLLSITDANALKQTFQYDSLSRLIKVISPTGEETVERLYRAGPTYNSPANARFVIYKKQGNAPPLIEHFDMLNRKIRTDKVNFNGQIIEYTTAYNSLGDDTGETGPGLNRSNQYDAVGRLARVTDYGLSNQYGYIGNQTTVTDITNRQQTVQKNAQGQLLQSKGTHDQIANTVAYEYDARNNPIRVAGKEGNRESFAIKSYYDARGYLIRTEDPVAGTYLYAYNGFGELTKQTNARNQVTTIEYDKLGRLTKRTDPEGVTTYVYDTGNKGIGKVSSINGYEGIKFAYSYDNFGRLAMEVKTINNINYTTGYTYNIDNSIDRITYPSGLIIKHEYNAQDYLYIVRRVSDNKVLWQAKTRNDADALLSEDIYAKNGGAVIRQAYAYDASLTHLMAQETYLPGDGATARLKKTFTYENNYNLSSTSEWTYKAPGQLLRSGTTQYEYDDLNRLTKIAPNLSFPQRNLTDNTPVTLTYDVHGNILNKSDVGAYRYDQNALGGARYLVSIDLINSGVCVPSFRVKTEYSSFNKVYKMENDSSYALIYYGPDRMRVMQKLYVRGKLTRTKIYVNSLYEVEQIGTQTQETSYVRGGTGVVAVETKTGATRTWQLWVKDQLSNLVAVVDTNGQVLQHLRYDVWGRRLNADAPGAISDSIRLLTERGFTKHEHYDLFGLIDMNGRIYDPVIARFLSPDPFIQDPLDLQAYNRYAYVQNNPLSYTDPSGFFLKKIGKAIGKVTDFVANVALKDPRNRLQLLGAYNAAKLVAKVFDAKFMPSVIRDNWRPVLTTAASIVVGVYTAPAGPAASGAASGFTSSFLGATWSNSSFNDATKAGTKGAAYGAISGYLTSVVGDATSAKQIGDELTRSGAKAVGHAAVQGTMAEVQGGNFWEGAAAGAASGATSGRIDQIMKGDGSFTASATRVSVAAALGGTTSILGGGKFANGAMSAAFERMYNGEHAITEFIEANSAVVETTKAILDDAAGLGGVAKDASYQKVSKSLDKIGKGLTVISSVNSAANGQFGDAFITAVGLIPVVGTVLSGVLTPTLIDTSSYIAPLKSQK